MIKYIFSINTGRSGSNYLAKILSHCESCVATHEPQPIMNGKAMNLWLLGKKKPLEKLMFEKIETIKKKAMGKVYVETNHCFIKGFGWYIPKYFPQEEIAVIILKRNSKEVAKSLQLNNTSPFNIIGRNWLILPTSKDCLLNPNSISNNQIFKFRLFRLIYRTIFYLKCYFKIDLKVPSYINRSELKIMEWYYDELHKRGEKYKMQFPRIKYYTIQIDELNKKEKVNSLINQLDLKPKASLYALLGNPTNKTSDRQHHLI